MPEKTDLNISPYYDDYSEDKNFHKVLYRAGRPIQARELTQSQSILQNQIERFGDHMFEEGSIVQGAQTDVDMEMYYVKVKSANPNDSGTATSETYRTSFHGKLVIGQTSGVVAKVLSSSAETSTDKMTLFVKYMRQGTDSANSFKFTANEELRECQVDSGGTYSEVSNNNEFQVETTENAPCGIGSMAKISEGIIYLRGFFVKVDAQELILEKYSFKPSYRIGLTITESMIDSSSDTSLQDNSTGTSNENAAGADRLKVGLTLSKFTITETTDANFVELARVNQGVIEMKVNRPMYNAIENTLARRTFDANGDFIVTQFTQSMREHLDNTINRGFYPAKNGGDESQFVMQISPGKAYVRGYEIDKIGTTTVPFPKARTTKALANTKTPIRLGNKLKVKNANSFPEFGNEASGQTQSPFGVVKIYDAVVASAGTENASGHIGFARVRDIDHKSGTSSSGVFTDDSIFNMYMFDIKMFTKLTGTASGTINVGDKVTGNESNATGIVAYKSSNDLYLHDVIGSFLTSGTEDLTFGNSTGSFSNISAVRSYNIDRARSLFQAPKVGGSAQKFTADISLDADKVLSGTLNMTAGNTTVTGFGTRFSAELKEGDILVDGAGNERSIVSFNSDFSEITLQSGGAAATYSGNVTRRRAKLDDQDQTANIFAWPRNWVKTHDADFIKVRRQQTETISSSGAIQISQTDGAFEARNADNFSISVVDVTGASSPSLSNGDILNIEDYTSASPTENGDGQNLSISGFGAANDDVILKVTYSILIANPDARAKEHRKGRVLKVSGDRSGSYTGVYGSAFADKEITLGVADVFKIHAIYEGTGGTTPLSPNATFANTVGTFVNHETIVGQTSDARAVIIDFNAGATSYYYMISGVFTEDESIVGQTSGATGTVDSVSQGSPNIKNRYFFDNGQRDGYYDLGKISLKPGEPAPSNSIIIVFDYFEAGAGDFFDVNSYDESLYKEIPVYSPNKVDLGGLEPDGTFELSDCVDFRPVAGIVHNDTDFGTASMDVASPTDLSTAIQFAPFGYETGTSFDSSRTGISQTNASTPDTPINGSTVQGDITFYVGRIDKLFLHQSGIFQIATGIPALSPTKPKVIDNAIELFELQIPPYTAKLDSIRVRSQDHRRYTMKDIGKISNRVTNLERVTSLSLLEKDTQTKQILDADGFDRFKSGFLVDNFRGHKIGDVNHPDYRVAIDTKLGVLRPQSYSQFFDMSLNTASSQNFKQTGDLITLPYTEASYVYQSKASRHINVNPYHVFAFIGTVKLTPESDIWNDSERLPEVKINREGNFDAVMSENANALGTVWNSWQTTWVGEPSVVSSEVSATSNGSWSGDPSQGGEWVAGLEITREITETPEIQTRTGVTTSVVEDIVETRNDRTVSVALIPFIRSKTIEIDATNLKPNSNHYFYFDNIAVDKYVRPHSATYSQDSGLTTTSYCKTDGNGRLRAFFTIPNNDTERFPTGQRELRVTSSFYNLSNPASNGSGMYQAQGLLQSTQTEITATRNGRVILDRVRGERTINRRGERLATSSFDENAPPIPVDQTPPVVEPIDQLPPPPPPQAPGTPPRVILVPPIIPPVVPPVIDIPVPIELPIIIDDRGPNVRDFTLMPDGRFMSSRLERGWGDPLAQSFLVEASGGMMMSSIDLFFQAKDANLPVSVDIRNMVNGYPGQTILPFSTVTKNPEDVNISTDGSTATTFTFDSPVLLEEDCEYCFVVYSNSNEYECWISRMGETDLATSQTISGQPYAGSLFMSQNASTWTAEQTDDLKFNMKIAKFDTSKTPVLYFENDDLSTSKLQESPIETFSGQSYVKVYNYMHGMYNTASNVTLSGITGDKTGCVMTIGTPSVSGTPNNGTFSGKASTGGTGTGLTFDITVVDNVITSCTIATTGSGYTAADSITISNFDGGTADADVTVSTVEDTLGGIPISAINKTFTTIANMGIDSFTIVPDLSPYNLKTGYTSDDSTLGGGANVMSTRNYYFDAIHTMIPNVQLKNTNIFVAVKTTPMNSPEGSISGTVYSRRTSSEFITLNDNVFFDSPSIIASPINEVNEMSSTKSFECAVQLQSYNPNVSPIIDTGSIGAIAISNRLNNIDTNVDVPTGTTYVSSNEPEGDNNAMVYVTRKVNLKTPASSIRVTADVFRPPTTDVKFMYKIIKNDEDTPLDDIGFSYFNTDGSPDVSTEADARNFKEYEFTVDDLPEFSSFIIKIVGQGENTSIVPLVSALRCIALAT